VRAPNVGNALRNVDFWEWHYEFLSRINSPSCRLTRGLYIILPSVNSAWHQLELE
jgi:hypothetical protein